MAVTVKLDCLLLSAVCALVKKSAHPVCWSPAKQLPGELSIVSDECPQPKAHTSQLKTNYAIALAPELVERTVKKFNLAGFYTLRVIRVFPFN